VKTAKGEVVLEADILLSAGIKKPPLKNIGLEEVGIVLIEIKSW
jgi:dihydrolipoamide dehydrogenase